MIRIRQANPQSPSLPIEREEEKLRICRSDRSVWVTETGLATWDLTLQRPARHDLQVRALDQIAAPPACSRTLVHLLRLEAPPAVRA